jgi:hypothetical protein
MSPSRPLLLAILSATTTLGLLTLGAPSVASAAVAPDAGPANRAASTSHSAYTPAAGTGASPATDSPSGCYQKADDPHDSGHRDGRMNGVVRTKCTRAVPRMSFTAQMWETRWWGWDRIGIKGSITVYGWSYAKTFGNDWCKNNTVRVTGNGYVIDVDGRTYYASTESAHVKNPCDL